MTPPEDAGLDKCQTAINELNVKVAMLEGKLMDRVRAEFVSKETYSAFTHEAELAFKTVRKLDKSVYAAIILAGLLLFLGRMASRWIEVW